MISSESALKLDKFKTPKIFKKNEVIFNQGELATQVYCLRAGMVKIETVSSEGANIIIGYLKGGDLLGLGAVLSGDISSSSAIAAEDTTACAFSAEFFRHILRDSPDLALRYMTKLMADLRHTQQRLLSGVEKDVPGRVAEALVYLKSNFADHRFTRKEIADWAGTTTESVIRTLSHFESEEMIRQEGRTIALVNKSALMQLAGIYF